MLVPILCVIDILSAVNSGLLIRQHLESLGDSDDSTICLLTNGTRSVRPLMSYYLPDPVAGSVVF